MRHKGLIVRITAECCRVLLGVVFIFSGFAKAIDPVGFSIKITEYLAAFRLDFLSSLSTFAAFNLIAVEFLLGVCLLLGAYRKYASFFTLLMMSVMTPLTLYLAIFDPVSDCGCFGDAVVITNWETFFKNVLLIAAAIFLFIYNKKILPFYTYRAIWSIPVFSYIFCCLFAYYNYIHLPIIDFRPYKVGANITDLMSIPEDAEDDVYNYVFIYEKDGEKKEFSLDSLPDSTWTFVDSKTELIREGFKPELESFNLYNLLGDDITETILNDQNGTFLLIAHKLEKASDERIDEINSVYDFALENELQFYGVTASSLDEINKWCDFNGAEYPFLMADDVMLKTVIRSNPGLVLLKNGTILGKWNYRDIPSEEIVDEVMGSALVGNLINEKEDGILMTFILSFAVTLLLIWVYDLFRNRMGRKIKPVVG